MAVDGSTVARIRQIATWSESAWEMAIYYAGPEYPGGSAERAESMRELAEDCATSYDAAIECLECQGADWLTYARSHLRDARSAESEGGDCSHADMALEVLAEDVVDDDDGA